MNQSSSSNVNDDPANNQDEQASHIYLYCSDQRKQYRATKLLTKY